jgi:glutamine cyclotransferase
MIPKLVQKYKHPNQFFTQGLTFLDPVTIVESVGMYGGSALYKYNPTTTEIVHCFSLPRQFFAEGMTYLPSLGKIYQGTWLNKKLFVYSLKGDILGNPNIVDFPYTCWGLAYDPEHHQLILSNGTRFLYFLDPERFTLIRRLNINVAKLNEIECWEKYIFANIWREDKILVLDKNTGQVLLTWDFSSISKPHRKFHRESVLNGIAIHPERKSIFITGKWWDTLYEFENPLLLR